MPQISSSPIQRVPLPTDISDSVNYLQSFMHSHASSADHPTHDERPASRPPSSAWSSPSPHWRRPTSYSEPREWPSSSMDAGHQAAPSWLSARSSRGAATASLSPLPQRGASSFTFSAGSARYRDAAANNNMGTHSTPLRYGWQQRGRREESDAGLGLGSVYTGHTSLDFSQRRGELGDGYRSGNVSVGGGGGGIGGGLWRMPPPSPVRPRYDDVGSLRSGGPYPVDAHEAFAPVRAVPTAHNARQPHASRSGQLSPRDRFTSRPPTKATTTTAVARPPAARPPRVPTSSASRRLPASATASDVAEPEAEARTYEVVIDVDEPEDDGDDAYCTHEEEEAYVEEEEEERVPERSPRRRAPDPPSVPVRRRATAVPESVQPSPPHAPLDLATCLKQQPHDDNLKDMASYLKDYYACDPAEANKGIETMEPEDVLGLVQCLYVDLYRIVRTLRSGLNLPIHMFSDGDPEEAIVIPTSAMPPMPSGDSGTPSRSPSQTSVTSAQSWTRAPPPPPHAHGPQPTTPQRSSPRHRGRETVQRIEAKVPAFIATTTAASMARGRVNQSAHGNTSTAPSSPAAGAGARADSYPHTGLAATRALSPEQALAASPSPPYRASPPRPATARSATTTPRRRTAAEKQPSRVSHTSQPPPAHHRTPALASRSSAASSTSATSARASRSASAHDQADVPLPPIAKRPLKTLMPVLRDGAYLVKHGAAFRAPHLRWFQIQDCVDSFHGRDVLMPHLTWANSPAEASKLTTDTAYNLVGLESVAIGAGKRAEDKASKLFKRKKGGVVDHKGQLIPSGMCVVLQFTGKKPLGLSFLSEDERQTWVGALMGVVERNRSITAKA